MANGRIIYPSGTTPQITYDFVHNYAFGHTVGYIEADDNVRAIDGTLNSYAGPQKKTFTLPFNMVLKAQLDYFMDLWKFQCPLDLYLDGTNLDAVVKIMSPIEGTSEEAWIGGEMLWSFEVTMEEV